MRTRWRVVGLPVLLLLCCSVAHAESFEALGQTVNVSNPGGYCTVGGSARERKHLEMARQALPRDVRLVHMAARCPEVEDFRNGRRDEFDHWLLIQLIGPNGNFKRIEASREAFVAGVARAVPHYDAAELNRRVQAVYEKLDQQVSELQVSPIGRDGNAFYLSYSMAVTSGPSTRRVTGLGGMTLVNALPLNVLVYEGTGQAKSREQLPVAHRQLLLSLLSSN